MKVVQCNKGYTLVETILVLLLLSSILLISFPNFQKTNEGKSVQHFFKQLELDLYESQMIAIIDGKILRFSFSNANRNYVVRDMLTPIIENQLPSGMTVVNGTLDYNGLRYLPLGTISNPGTLLFFHKQDKYVLVFQFVRGRFYIEKNGGLYVY